MKVVTIIGTRPEMIKMSEIIRKLDKRVAHVLVHTDQNYDKNLQDVFYDDLDLRRPNYHLNVAGNSLGESIAKVIQETEKVLQAENPDAVLIHGDTNSALASIIVKRSKVPLFHLEAGNRCFDDNVPEEVNRRLIDHISDVNMVYSENSRRYLLNEGFPANRIFHMGSPMLEVLEAQSKRISKSRVLKDLKLKPKSYYLVSIHREENLDIEANLINLVVCINMLAEATKSTIVMTVHPRTAKKFQERDVKFSPLVMRCDPFNFSDYIKLQQNARCVISDSGTISEESALLNFPAVTIRNAIERPEALDAGSIVMSGVSPDNFMLAVSGAMLPNSIPQDYLVDNTSERVVKLVMSYTDYIKRYVWHLA